MHVIRQGIKTLLTACLPRRMWLTHGPPGGRACAVTFDDGPHPEHTPRILDQLAMHGVRATFFVIGLRAAQHPDLVRRIAAEGHELGNHSYFHADPAQTDAQALVTEIRRTRALLEDLTGKSCNLFRPPKGKLDLAKTCGIWRESQTIVLWNVDPRDYMVTSAEPLARWCAGYHPTDGDILLLHDDRPFTTELVDRLLPRFTERDLQLQCASDWFRPLAPTQPVAR